MIQNMCEILYVKNYDVKSWTIHFHGSIIDIKTLPIHDSWLPLFHKIFELFGKEVNAINDFIIKVLKTDDVYPYPKLLFRAFNCTPFNIVKVVILGQDPYYNTGIYDNIIIPKATGMSFAVPEGMILPPSLRNIFMNQRKYGHIESYSNNGDLVKWAQQGCLLLNTTLTVTDDKPNSHESKWGKITDYIIKYISDNCDNVVFMLWGKPSLGKMGLIDPKHKIIVSSHPSPQSCYNKLGSYPSFFDTDHFGIANEYLTNHKQKCIDWSL